MKRFLLFALLLAACGSEDKVSPASASTFIRYFNGGNNDVAASILETPDKGLLILATTEIKPNELTASHFKIKLIKTDAAGNMEWQKFYPPFGDTASYKAGGMFIKDDGTVAIAGSDMRKGTPYLMLLTTDALNNAESVAFNTKTILSPSNVVGTAVTVNVGGDFMVLGSIPDPTVLNNTLLARISPPLDSLLWSQILGDDPVVMANKVYLDATKTTLFLGGTTQRTSTTSMKLTNVEISPNNEGGIISNPNIGDPTYQVFGNDFCRYGDYWAFIGSTNEKRTPGASSTIGDLDIIFYKIPADNPQFGSTSVTYPIEGVGEAKDGSGQNETGNSICVTKDGGLLLLGTVNSLGAFGEGGKDYYLIKTDPFGSAIWTKQYGSKFDDNGVQVIQASDGGYIVLGTTTLANLKSIMLMKTDTNGEIQ